MFVIGQLADLGSHKSVMFLVYLSCFLGVASAVRSIGTYFTSYAEEPRKATHGLRQLSVLVRACREDGWVLDEAALDRPLFPAVDEATGNFLFTESFQVRRICRRGPHRD